MMKERGDLIRRMLQGSYEGSCFMADIAFGPRQVARMDREFQRVIEIVVWIALGGIGRQKEQLDFIPMPVQPGCDFLPMVHLISCPKSGKLFGRRSEPAGP